MAPRQKLKVEESGQDLTNVVVSEANEVVSEVPETPPVEKAEVPVDVMVLIPVMPPAVQLLGYMSRVQGVELQFSPSEAAAFRRIYAGLHASHVTYKGIGDRQHHVDTASDVIRWLLEQVAIEEGR